MKRITVTFPVDRTVVAFFAGSPGEDQYSDCSFAYGVYVNSCFADGHETMQKCPCNSEWENAAAFSCQIFHARPFSAVSHTFNRRFDNMRSCSFVTLSSVVAVFGAPGFGLSKPSWNSLNHCIQHPALFDFTPRFPFQSQELNHWLTTV